MLLELAALLGLLLLWASFVDRSTAAARGFGFPLAWALSLAQLPLTDALLADQPAGLRMVGLIATTMLALKTVTLAARRAEGMASLGTTALLLYALAWVGMEPKAFARRGPPRPAELSATRQLTVTAVAVAAFVLAGYLKAEHRVAAEVALMLGASLVLHFTLLRLVGAALRRLGYAVREPFDRPLASTSLREFWGRRWNRPFIELGALAVYRPLAEKVGRPAAAFGMFAVSGALHEMAISLPVRSHFGGPLAYFVLHGLLNLLERGLEASGQAPRGPWGRVWTIGWLVVPLPVLFHRPFLDAVLLPLAP